MSARGEPSPSCVASAPVSARLVMQRARGACVEGEAGRPAWEGGEGGQQGRGQGDVDQDEGASNDGKRYITCMYARVCIIKGEHQRRGWGRTAQAPSQTFLPHAAGAEDQPLPSSASVREIASTDRPCSASSSSSSSSSSCADVLCSPRADPSPPSTRLTDASNPYLTIRRLLRTIEVLKDELRHHVQGGRGEGQGEAWLEQGTAPGHL